MNVSPDEFGQILAGYCNAVRADAPTSADLAAIKTELSLMSDGIARLLAEQTKLQEDVKAQTTVVASAVTAFAGLAAQLAAAEATAKAAGITDEQIAAFATVRTTLEGSTAALAAAIPHNTVAATEVQAPAPTATAEQPPTPEQGASPNQPAT